MLANLADIGKIAIFVLDGGSERTVRNWPEIPGYLRETCLTAQNDYAELLVYFGIKH